MRKCQKCGSDICEDELYCGKCGTKYEEPAKAVRSEKPSYSVIEYDQPDIENKCSVCNTPLSEDQINYGITICNNCSKKKDKKLHYAIIAGVLLIILVGAILIYPSFDNKSDVSVSYDTSGGMVTGTGTFVNGTEITLTAKEKSGYDFVGWYDQYNRLLSKERSYMMTVSDNCKLNAKFSNDALKVNFGHYSYGKATGNGAYLYGESATLIATPNGDCFFKGWYQDDNLLSSEIIYRFTVNDDMTLTPVFYGSTSYMSIVCMNIDTETTPGTVIGAGSHTSGTEVTLTAIPNIGFIFNGWYENGELLYGGSSYTFTAMGDRHLEARFALNKNAAFRIVQSDIGMMISAIELDALSEADITRREWRADNIGNNSAAIFVSDVSGMTCDFSVSMPTTIMVYHTIYFKDGTSDTYNLVCHIV